jgi:hypothetical protein
MEGVSGGLNVVDALPASEDPAAASLVSCAQDVLRGRKVSMGGVQIGDRYETTYALTPPRPSRDRADPLGGRGAASAGTGRVFQRQRGKGTAAPVQ